MFGYEKATFQIKITSVCSSIIEETGVHTSNTQKIIISLQVRTQVFHNIIEFPFSHKTALTLTTFIPCTLNLYTFFTLFYFKSRQSWTTNEIEIMGGE